MINRAVDLVGFVVCAGVAGVWSIFDREKLFTFLLFLGLIFYIHRRTGDRAPHHEDEPSQTITRIKALVYAQGLSDGMARSGEQSKDGHRLPRVG